MNLTCRSVPGHFDTLGTGSPPECGQPAVGGVVYVVPYDSRGGCEECGYDSEPLFMPLCALHINEAKADGLADDQVVVTMPEVVEWDPPLSDRKQCGHFDAMLGPCVCGDPANHQPGGKFYQARHR